MAQQAPAPSRLDPSETLALIAEHRLTVEPDEAGWVVVASEEVLSRVYVEDAYAPTIVDAVRLCVARIKEAK